jgi:Glycosyl hydrolase family 76
VTDGSALVAAERAEQAWRTLETRGLVRSGGDQVLAKDGPQRGAPISAVWPFGQVIAAAAAMLGLDVNGKPFDATTVPAMLRGLERYRSRDGYGAFPGDHNRYYDDNAWIALDRLQLAGLTGEASHLDAATSLFGFLGAGEVPAGGVLWVEGDESRNTCSTGPTAQVALRLYLATGEEPYLRFAERQMDFLDRVLRDDAGLYRDHVGADGAVEPTVWSYNQGTPIGASVLLGRITGDHAWIERATQTAFSAAAHFGADDGWWRQPPVFNAIFFRNLLALLAVAPSATLLGVVDDYLDRVWTQSRHRRTGLFVDAGIGSYDGHPTIDQAGLTQVFAFRAWDPDRWPDIC